MVWRIGGGGCLLEVIQQLGKPPRIPQKEPSQHRLKSRGLPVAAGFGRPGSAAGLVTAAADLFPFAFAKPRLENPEGPGLGLRPDLRHHGAVQILRAGRPAAMAQALVQLPHRIAEPGQLEGTEFGRRGMGRHPGDPPTGVGTDRILCGRNGGLRRR